MSVDNVLWVAIGLIAIAYIFDFTNGFHDAANSIATVVATKTLTPFQAVAMAAFFNFAIMFFINFKVASTIGKGIVDPTGVTLYVVFGCLVGACVWNIITWILGMPTSSSHALIGGLVGSAVTANGWQVVNQEGLSKILVFIVAAPIIGFALGASINVIIRNIFPTADAKQDKWFRNLQLFSSACYSMGHGANDAQKTAGIVFLILLASGLIGAKEAVPMWAIWTSFVVMGLGTLVGGWRIVQTLGFKLTHLTPRQGFAAEAGGSAMLFTASAMGVPVSTTHVITGSILGAGASEPDPKVKWKKAWEIVVAWILTIPCSALMGSAFYYMSTHITI